MLLVRTKMPLSLPTHLIHTPTCTQSLTTFKRHNALTRMDTLKSGFHLYLKYLKNLNKRSKKTEENQERKDRTNASSDFRNI